MKTNIAFTKNEARIISIMLFSGLAITIISILPFGSSDSNFGIIIVNIFYWASTMIMINIQLHNVLERKIEGTQSHDSVKRES